MLSCLIPRGTTDYYKLVTNLCYEECQITKWKGIQSRMPGTLCYLVVGTTFKPPSLGDNITLLGVYNTRCGSGTSVFCRGSIDSFD